MLQLRLLLRVAPLAIASIAIPSLALTSGACSRAASLDDSPGAKPAGDDTGNGDDDEADGGVDPTLGSDAAACTTASPPSGPSCACHYTSCDGSTIECDCAPECYSTKSDCLISVDGGKPHSDDGLLSTCSIECTLVPATTGEFPKPAQMVCTVHNCKGALPPPPPPPPTG